jgi:predicted DNA-binding protein (MmcQ/YjbR family)
MPTKKSHTMVLSRLRRICLTFPEVTETTKWGHPTFVVGRKMFAVFDEYRGERSIAFRVPPLIQADLIRTPGYFAAPYAARYGWVCARLDALRWGEVAEFLRTSYRLAAPKRILASFDLVNSADRGQRRSRATIR